MITRYHVTRTIHTTTREVLLEAMNDYDPTQYAGGDLQALAQDEFDNTWTVNNVDTFATLEEAQAAQEEQPRASIFEITPGDIADALESLFGNEASLTAATLNDATELRITDERGIEILDIPLNIHTEDEDEFNREADAYLADYGFTRTGPWTSLGTAPVARSK